MRFRKLDVSAEGWPPVWTFIDLVKDVSAVQWTYWWYATVSTGLESVHWARRRISLAGDWLAPEAKEVG
jgi:hypothetical protein